MEENDNYYNCRAECGKSGFCPLHCQEQHNQTPTVCSRGLQPRLRGKDPRVVQGRVARMHCKASVARWKVSDIWRVFFEQHCNATIQAKHACENLCHEKGYCTLYCEETAAPCSSDYENCTEDCMEEFCMSTTDADGRFCENVSCSLGYGAGFVVAAGAIYLSLGLKTMLRQNRGAI